MESGILRMPFSNPLTAFRGDRIPELLGDFVLDKHNVEEWSNNSDPALKHLARKEVGKWVNPERNADIQIQRQDDAKRSAKGTQNQRTEVIQGTSPDSQFEIVRTERQSREGGGGGEGEGSSSRTSSMSTSYQMSSSRGMRFTSKTTSNKTTTTTATVSTPRIMEKGDDFENLKIKNHLLDTSKQRERINVSRSGTMGIRRPPTRKQPNSHQEIETTVTTPSLDHQPSFVPSNEVNDLPIVSTKIISPKILVGFPAEVQVELRTKLKMDAEGSVLQFDPEKVHTAPASSFSISEKPFEINPPESSFSRFRRNSNDTSWNRPTDGLSNGVTSLTSKSVTPTKSKTYLGDREPSISYVDTFSPSGISRSWDLIQRLGTHIPKESTTLDDNKSSSSKPLEHGFLEALESKSKFSVPKSLISDSRLPEHSFSDRYALDSLEPCAEESLTVDQSKHDDFDESFPNPEYSDKLSTWDAEWEKTKTELNRLHESINYGQIMDTKIGPVLPKGSLYPFTSRNYANEEGKETYFNGMSILSSGGTSLGRYTANVLEGDEGATEAKVSQTWISAADMSKPSRHAHDNELSTSISSKNDSDPKRMCRKVEFCKTEVHFAPEPGKFHIVESAENKPSTVHLFRRRKRKTSVESDPALLPKGEEVNDLRGGVIDLRGGVTDLGNGILDNHGYGNDREVSIRPIVTPKLLSQDLQIQNGGNLWSDLENEFEGEGLRGLSRPIGYNYEDLKIQKYLNQLKPLNLDRRAPGDSNYAHNQFVLDQVRTDYGAAEAEDDDEELHFRYGSFVPLATRQSLIEMNNRNGHKFLNYSATNSSQMSEVSSIGSYSLPHSETSSREPCERPLIRPFVNLYENNLEEHFRPLQHELRHGVLDTEDLTFEDRGRDRIKSLRLQSYEPMSERLLTVPEPVMPFDHPASGPHRSGRRSFSASPVRDVSKRYPKPPTPVLPIQFSTFEKTGEALRSRVVAKASASKCHCSTESEVGETVPRHVTNRPETLVSMPQEPRPQNRLEAPILMSQAPRLQNMTTVVNIVADEPEEIERRASDSAVVGVTAAKGTSITRSLTFPKSSRSEPEWVSKARAKAKDRATQGIEWTAIGQRQVTSSVEINNNNPPWISELRIRNRASPVREQRVTTYAPVNAVYPWQRDAETLNHDDSGETQRACAVDDVLRIPVFPHGPTATSAEIKSASLISATVNNNRSLVDLNRDLESITINPNQIEFREDVSTQKSNSKNRGGAGLVRPNGSITGRGVNLRRSSPLTSGKTSPSRGAERIVENGVVPSSARKPLQTSATVNQNVDKSERKSGNRSEVSQKPKTPPKPPKPPQRISSLVNPPTVTALNASLEKKKRISSPKDAKAQNSKDAVVDPPRPPNVVIHRHPTVKISKLPSRTSSSSPISKTPSPDTMEPIKKKSHASLVTEAKRICKVKGIKTTVTDSKRGNSRTTGQQLPVPSASPQQRKR